MECCRKPVEVAQPFFRGELRHVIHLEEGALHRDRLRELIMGGHIIVSSDGLSATRLLDEGKGVLSVSHAPCEESVTFRRDISALPNAPCTRLLNLDANCLLVFGTHTSGTTGVFRLWQKGLELVTEAGSLLGVQRTPSGNVAFVRHSGDEKDTIRIVAPFLSDALRVHRGAFLSSIGKELLVLEPIDLGFCTMFHRYRVSTQDGFEDLHPVPLQQHETPLGFVRWYDMYLLAVRTLSGCAFKAMGNSSRYLKDRHLPIVGELEYLWQSPTGRAYAFVARTQSAGNRIVRQFVINRKVIFVGDFTVGAFDLVWSPDGRRAALRIKHGRHAKMLVSHSSRVQFRPRHDPTEFVVNDDGHITAWIESDGRFCRPFVHGVPHDGVEFAWNLHLETDGMVWYNRVLSDVVMRVTDRTNRSY